jgi:hypothetical protein
MAINSLSTGWRPGVCTSSTRPTAPYEGQQIYETDTDLLRIWNGSAWKNISAAAPAQGTVLQTVYGSTTTQVTNNSTTYLDTNLTATITPTSASSNILIYVSQGYGTQTASVISTRVMRGATVVNTFGHSLYSAANFILGYTPLMSTDSPSTTSAVTYKTMFAIFNNTSVCYTNFNDVNGVQRSTMILMEIAA